MRHRGPDEGGTWYDDDVVIGFRRLSIIDIDHSHQPLPWLDGRYQLIFNGEIYNYLELRERLAREFGAVVRHRRRRRGDRRRLPLPRREDRARAARHVRVPDLGLPGARAVRRPRLVRHQAAVHLHRRARLVLRQREEVAARRRRPTARRRRRDRAAALPDAAVRARAGVDAHARSGASSPARTSRCARASRCAPHRYFHPDFAIRPVPEPDKLYREIAEALEDSVAKHMRADVTVGVVPVRRHRLDRDRRAGQAAQPEPADLHHRLRARGLQRDRRRGRVGRGDRRRAHHQGRHAPRR